MVAKLKFLDQQAADLLGRIRIRADDVKAYIFGLADNVQSAVNAYLRGELADLHNQHADLCSRRAYNFPRSVDIDADLLCDQFADLFSPRTDLSSQQANNFQSALDADVRGPLAENVHGYVNAEICCQLACLRGQLATNICVQ